jgi:hypothetical protein
VINERRSLLRRAEDRLATRSGLGLTRLEGVRPSWGGIWAGILVGVGLLLLLTTLGLAVGVSSVDTDASQAQRVGTGAAVWAAISLLLALYVGGMASTRLGAVFDKTAAVLQGALVWVLSVLLIGYLAASGVGLLAGGAFKLFGGATQVIGSAATSGVTDLSQGSVDEVLQRLRDPQVIATVAAASGVPEDQVRARFSEITAKVEAARQDPAQAAAEVRQGVQNLIQQARSEGRLSQVAERAREAASKTAWLTLLALVLSLIAAVAGALSGRRTEIIRGDAATVR